jgi:hypothetical protein
VRTFSSGDFYAMYQYFVRDFVIKLGKNLLADKTVLKDRKLQAFSKLTDR